MESGRSEHGQILVVFVLGLIALLASVALVFDVGQSLADKRSRQNAADAAALAGARYVESNPAQARAVALDVAEKNGYKTGVDGITVTVKIPPGPETDFAGLAGYIEVTISGSRPASFSGAVGISDWRVGALAVAANTTGTAAPYAFLALDPTSCGAAQFSGNGSMAVGGNIQVNSSCPSGALKVTGNASVTVTATDAGCNVHGGIQLGGIHAELDCIENPGAPVVPDPLAALPGPPVPGAPAPVVAITAGAAIPDACPGGLHPATAANPAPCQFSGSSPTTTWRLSPGFYPGGIVVTKGTILLEPGIYWLGGGGWTMNGASAFAYTVDSGATSAVLGGGVMFYNSEDPHFHAQCLAGTAPNPAVDCINQIKSTGASTNIHLLPLHQNTQWDGLVIYQDRSIVPSPDIQINGSGTSVSIKGTLYAPKALVKINGDAGSTLTTQVIANRFLINGSSGLLTVAYAPESYIQFSGQGLVQ